MNPLINMDKIKMGRPVPRMTTKRLAYAVGYEQMQRKNRLARRDAFTNSLPNELSGILDDLKAIVSPYIGKAGEKLKKEFFEQIAGAQEKLEAKIGEFLQTGAKLTDLKARAQAQQNSPKPEVKARAMAIASKASALQLQYQAIKEAATAAGSKLVALRTAVATNPALNFDNPMAMGTRVVELFNTFKSDVAANVSAAASVAVRINNHIKDVNKLNSDVNDLEAYAQGRGVSSIFDSATGMLGGQVSKVVTIAAIAGAAWLIVPTLMARTARAR